MRENLGWGSRSTAALARLAVAAVRHGQLAAVFLVACSGALLVAGVSAAEAKTSFGAGVPASGATRPVPIAVRSTCRHNQTLCTGYWTMLDGQTVYMIGRSVAVASGSAHVSAVTGWHTERNYGINQCMSSYGVASGANGGAATHYACNGSQNQRWNVYFQGTWEYYYDHWGFINGGDGMCLLNRWGSHATDNIETLWTCDPGDTKQWYQFVDGGLGISPWFDSGMCLSSLGYTLYGDDIYLFGCNGSPNQEWGG